MNVIIVTGYKRKLLILSAVALLWVILIMGAGIIFDSTIKYTVSVNSSISFSYPATMSVTSVYAKNSDASPYIQASNSTYKNFIDFKSSEGGFEFKYPAIFKIDQQKFPGSEILYHIDFKNKKDKSYNGFVQVWNIPTTLEQFLEASKEASTNEFINFTSEKITVNKLNGYFWDYEMESATEKYKCLEVFLGKNSKLYRISYYIPEKKYTRADYDIFFKIVDSFTVK